MGAKFGIAWFFPMGVWGVDTALPVNGFPYLLVIFVVKNVFPSIIRFLWVSTGWGYWE